MLEFVGKGAADGLAGEHQVVSVQDEHLVSVGEGVGFPRHFICRGEITQQATAHAPGEEEVDMGVFINARTPLAAKKGGGLWGKFVR